MIVTDSRCEKIVKQGGHNGAHDPGDVSAAKPVREGAFIIRSVEERNLDKDGEKKDPYGEPIDTAVDTIDLKEFADCIVSPSHQVKVCKVDRSPRDEDDQNVNEEIFEVGQEVCGR